MLIDPLETSKARDLLSTSLNVHCICHRGPDGDAIGSMLGIGLLIERLYPEKTITFHCVDPVPDLFHFLPGAFRVQGPPVLPADAASSLFIFVDSAEPKLTDMHESHPDLFNGTYKSIMIDHHPRNPLFGTANFLDVTASSACEVITNMVAAFGWTLDPDTATCLLTGVYTDTGGLLHSNVTPAVYRAVAALTRAGGRRHEVVSAVFRSSKLSTLRLWGRVLEKISLTDEGGAISAVTEGDFRATGADYSELTGAIDYVNAVPGMRFSLILSERDGKVKGSLRTLRDDVDVAQMAGKFSGGGHRKAAGFALTGKLKPEVRWKVVDSEDSKDSKESKDPDS